MTTASDIKLWLQRSTFLKAELLESESFDQLVKQRMRRQGSTDAADYLRLLQASSMELEHMVEGVAVQESWLFRYPTSYEVLADHLRQLRHRRNDGGWLRMVSVGCAAGQEPVSMAITALHAGWSADRVIIDALDFNAGAIDRARQGLYPRRALRSDRPVWADAWLDAHGDQVQVRAVLPQMIRYDHADALAATAMNTARNADALFCRNVLIYLHDQARNTLLTRFANQVVLGGLLFLGHAEGSYCHDLFEPLGVPHAFAWQRIRSKKTAPTAARHAHKSTGNRSRQPVDALTRRCGTQSGATGDRPEPTTRTVRHGKREALRFEDQRSSAGPAPTTLDAFCVALAQAQELANHGKLEAAREAAEAMLTDHGPSPDALELLGSIYLALDSVDHARRCFRKAVYLDPQREAARLQLELLESAPQTHGMDAPRSTQNQPRTSPS